MWFMQFHVVIVGFVTLVRQDSISVTGKASIRDVKAGKTTNGFFCHVKENAGHKIDWESAVFVDYEKNWIRRKIKEAIYINAINPTKAIIKKGILNLEKGYDLDAIWSEFNGVLRNSIAKKVGRAV